VAIGLTGYVDAQKILGYADLKTCRPAGMHYFSDRGTDVFPRYFARLLEPYSRVAADRISSDGQDIRIQRDHVFGSSGRSAVMVDGAFREYLRREGLIEIEAPLGTYHFKAPWDARKLAALGIRYVMSPVPDPAAAANGWELLGYAQEILYVYENPLPTGLVYLKDAAGELEPIASQRLFMRGSVIAVSLPEITRSLEFVATFIHVPGWQARVDGVSREIISGPDRLMRVLLRRGDQRIEMRYQPFAWYHFAAGILAALAVAGLGWCFLRRDSFKYQRIV
jgi:hypothetical protein